MVLPHDYSEAFKWFSLATRFGSAAVAVEQRQAVAGFLTPQQVADAEVLELWMADFRIRIK
jgi:hypothetical protein